MQSHAILWVDHRNALLIEFDRLRARSRRFEPEDGNDEGDADGPRDGLAWFETLVAAMGPLPEILIVGPNSTRSDLMRYIEARHPALGRRVVAVEAMAPTTETALLAHARNTFSRIDRMRNLAPALA